MIESYLAIPALLGFVGLLVALGIYVVVSRYPAGNEAVTKIGNQIHSGAMTFMRREYSYLVPFASVQKHIYNLVPHILSNVVDFLWPYTFASIVH